LIFLVIVYYNLGITNILITILNTIILIYNISIYRYNRSIKKYDIINTNIYSNIKENSLNNLSEDEYYSISTKLDSDRELIENIEDNIKNKSVETSDLKKGSKNKTNNETKLLESSFNPLLLVTIILKELSSYTKKGKSSKLNKLTKTGNKNVNKYSLVSSLFKIDSKQKPNTLIQKRSYSLNIESDKIQEYKYSLS